MAVVVRYLFSTIHNSRLPFCKGKRSKLVTDNNSFQGQKFTADLLADGRIRWREEDKLFGSPSAWAIHCKKIVNPMKKSGCGWASVRIFHLPLKSFGRKGSMN